MHLLTIVLHTIVSINSNTIRFLATMKFEPAFLKGFLAVFKSRDDGGRNSPLRPPFRPPQAGKPAGSQFGFFPITTANRYNVSFGPRRASPPRRSSRPFYLCFAKSKSAKNRIVFEFSQV